MASRGVAASLLDGEPSLAIARLSPRRALPSARVLDDHHRDTGAALDAAIGGIEESWNGGTPLPELRRLLELTDGGLAGEPSPSADAVASRAMASSLASYAREVSGLEELPHDIEPPSPSPAAVESSLPHGITPPTSRADLTPVQSPASGARRATPPRSSTMRLLLASGAVVLDEGTPPLPLSPLSRTESPAGVAATLAADAGELVASLQYHQGVRQNDNAAEIGQRWRKVAVTWDTRRRETWRQMAALMVWKHGMELAAVVQRTEVQLQGFALKRWMHMLLAMPWRAWAQWTHANNTQRRAEAAAQRHAQTTAAHSEALGAVEEMLTSQSRSWEAIHTALTEECESTQKRLGDERDVQEATVRQLVLAKGSVVDLEEQLTRDRTEKGSLQAELEDVRQSLQKRIEGERSVHGITKTELHELRRENAELRKQGIAERAELTRERTEKAAWLAELEDARQSLQAKLESAQESPANTTAALHESRADSLGLQRKGVTDQIEIAELKSQLEGLRSELAAATVVIDSAVSSVMSTKESAAAAAAAARQRWAAEKLALNAAWEAQLLAVARDGAVAVEEAMRAAVDLGKRLQESEQQASHRLGQSARHLLTVEEEKMRMTATLQEERSSHAVTKAERQAQEAAALALQARTWSEVAKSRSEVEAMAKEKEMHIARSRSDVEEQIARSRSEVEAMAKASEEQIAAQAQAQVARAEYTLALAASELRGKILQGSEAAASVRSKIVAREVRERCFWAWVQVATTQARHRATACATVLRRISGSSQRRGWTAWTAYVRDLKTKKAKNHVAVQQAQRWQWATSRMLLKRAFREWRVQVAENEWHDVTDSEVEFELKPHTLQPEPQPDLVPMSLRDAGIAITSELGLAHDLTTSEIARLARKDLRLAAAAPNWTLKEDLSELCEALGIVTDWDERSPREEPPPQPQPEPEPEPEPELQHEPEQEMEAMSDDSSSGSDKEFEDANSDVTSPTQKMDMDHFATSWGIISGETPAKATAPPRSPLPNASTLESSLERLCATISAERQTLQAESSSSPHRPGSVSKGIPTPNPIRRIPQPAVGINRPISPLTQLSISPISLTETAAAAGEDISKKLKQVEIQQVQVAAAMRMLRASSQRTLWRCLHEWNAQAQANHARRERVAFRIDQLHQRRLRGVIRSWCRVAAKIAGEMAGLTSHLAELEDEKTARAQREETLRQAQASFDMAKSGLTQFKKEMSPGRLGANRVAAAALDGVSGRVAAETTVESPFRRAMDASTPGRRLRVS